MVCHKASILSFVFALLLTISWKKKNREYVDDEGDQQGPYSTSQMREWYDAGFFTPQVGFVSGRQWTVSLSSVTK
jgi:hypothetical protein